MFNAATCSDEIDSILASRESLTNEASLKEVTSLMVELEGFLSSSADQIFVLAATNRPFAMDSGELRRFKLQVLIDLPECAMRYELIECFFRRHKRKLALTPKQIRYTSIDVL